MSAAIGHHKLAGFDGRMPSYLWRPHEKYTDMYIIIKNKFLDINRVLWGSVHDVLEAKWTKKVHSEKGWSNPQSHWQWSKSDPRWLAYYFTQIVLKLQIALQPTTMSANYTRQFPAKHPGKSYKHLPSFTCSQSPGKSSWMLSLHIGAITTH
jgi:hypothetical protein